MDLTEEIIAIMVAFGGGKGGEPGNVAVRFLLPSLFWGILAYIAFREWRRTDEKRDWYVGIAALIGLGRELLMFAAEYGSLRGFISFSSIYNFYPPLEHAATMLSCIFIGGAFINYLSGWKRFSRNFIISAATITILLYIVTAIQWPVFLKTSPGAGFAFFWGDIVYRTTASIFMGIVLSVFVYLRTKRINAQNTLLLGFLFFFLDEFLMIFNITSHEHYVNIFAPLRHNLHIWAIPFLLAFYWSDLKLALKKALRDVDQERAKSEAIIAGIGDGISIQNTNFTVLYQNDVHKSIVGNHKGETCYKGYEKREAVCEGCPVELSFKDGNIHRTERSFIFPEGTRYFDITTSPLKDPEGKIIAGIEVVRDITALKEEQKALEAEKERLAVTLRSIGDAVIVTDVNGVITLINKVAEELTGWSAKEAAGRPLSDVFNIINEQTREKAMDPVGKVMGSGLVVGLANHTALVRKDGSEITIEDSAAPIRDPRSEIIGVVLVFRDVTEKKRMETELMKSRNLESMGLLAGGLAHDFNNLLTSIFGNISESKMLLDSSHPAHERLLDAERASLRAVDLTRQLLTFSRGGAPVKKTASIESIIQESVNFTLSGSTVKAEFIISKGLPNVEVDAGQMSQVFNNLAINALQAMPNGGIIRISADKVIISEKEVPALEAGEYVKITISDTGTGIPSEFLPKIFDPYFTTKQEGNGLGLTTVYSIIKKHGGHIAVESKPGAGTTFQIYLQASRKQTSESALQEVLISGGKKNVLVMDDEELVRSIAGHMLGRLGFEVTFAHDGTKALDLYQKALGTAKTFSIVIMDLTVPGGMGGKETIQKLLAIDPLVKAIVSSGYSNDPVMADYSRYGFKGAVEKPYSKANLSRAIRDALSV